jgi:hypothetical protein
MACAIVTRKENIGGASEQAGGCLDRAEIAKSDVQVTEPKLFAETPAIVALGATRESIVAQHLPCESTDIAG